MSEPTAENIKAAMNVAKLHSSVKCIFKGSIEDHLTTLANAVEETIEARAAMLESLESLIATEYCLNAIRPTLEKIEGPCWSTIFESLRQDIERVDAAIKVQAKLGTSPSKKDAGPIGV